VRSRAAERHTAHRRHPLVRDLKLLVSGTALLEPLEGGGRRDFASESAKICAARIAAFAPARRRPPWRREPLWHLYGREQCVEPL
jgi:hypothetical protein